MLKQRTFCIGSFRVKLISTPIFFQVGSVILRALHLQTLYRIYITPIVAINGEKVGP